MSSLSAPLAACSRNLACSSASMWASTSAGTSGAGKLMTHARGAHRPESGVRCVPSHSYISSTVLRCWHQGWLCARVIACVRLKTSAGKHNVLRVLAMPRALLRCTVVTEYRCACDACVSRMPRTLVPACGRCGERADLAARLSTCRAQAARCATHHDAGSEDACKAGVAMR